MNESNRLEQIRNVVQKSHANYEYFFAKLDSPVWIPALRKAGFFSKPPHAEREDGWIRYPAWPESEYLLRVASEVPSEALEVALAIPDTDNVRIHGDLVAMATHLPGDLAKELAHKESRWFADYKGPDLLLPTLLPELIVHLLDEDQIDVGLTLAGQLLEILPADSPHGARGAATARIDDWHYTEALKQIVPVLVRKQGSAGFAFVCDLLDSVVRIGFRDPDKDTDGDLTYVWRPAIENHAQNLGHSLLDSLVDSVRDLALELSVDEDSVRAVVEELDRHQPKVFRRLVLFVLERRSNSALSLIDDRLTDPELVNDHEIWHEYGELLRSAFALLPVSSQEEILAGIRRGSGDEWTDHYEERGISRDDFDRIERRWKLERYSLIAESLTSEDRAAYDELLKELGEPDHPTFHAYSTSWVGPTSPLGKDQLQNMEATEIARNIAAWTPSGEPTDPSPEGLGRILLSVVEDDPGRFADAIDDFIGLDATHVRHLVAGFEQAVKGERGFDWSRVLDLCTWIVQQPLAASGQSAFREGHDPSWQWARKAVASLLSQGFNESPAELPWNERDRAWSLLEVLTTDPDPTLEHEEQYGPPNMDFFTLSINTARGEAMHAVMRYLVWIERHLSTEGAFDGMGSAPEARAVLEYRLNPEVDPSLAVRAVYGVWFADLVRFDNEWAAAHVESVFPFDRDDYFRAAWDAYITSTRPYLGVFDLLHPAYRHAVSQLAANAQNEGNPISGKPSERLTEHLGWYCVMGKVSLDEEDLLASFWSEAATELKTHLVLDVGRSLEGRGSADTEIPGDVLQNFRELWSWVYSWATSEGGDVKVLAPFGYWLASRVFPNDWALAQATAVLRNRVQLDPDFLVYGALASFAVEHPSETIDVMRLMIETDVNAWSVQGSLGEVREILTAVMASENSGVQNKAAEVIQLLGARGHTAFRDLLPTS